MKADDRYIRLTQLGWSMDILKNMRCLVVGAGALGNEVIKNLALLGVGAIVIIDMDSIENSNLTRSVLFREGDIDKFKSVIAAERAVEIDASIQTHSIVGEFQHCLGSGAFYDFDVIFGCLDNIQARIDLTKSCMLTNKLYIDAGLHGIDGDLKIFGSGYEVCFDCLLTRELRNEAWRRHSCLKLRSRNGERPSGPTAPTISSVIAALQVQFAVKHLHNMNIPFNHRIAVHGHLNDFSVVRLNKNPHCPTHYKCGVIETDDIMTLELTIESTCLELYEKVVGDLGTGATIDLEFDLITDVHCSSHNNNKDILKKRGSIFEDEILCPDCLNEGKQKIESIMSDNVYSQITGKEPFINCKLREIGIAPKSIIKAYKLNEDDIRFRYYLLNDRYL